jgi:HAE1 family hydrophobic/amphiphilic exporter-1
MTVKAVHAKMEEEHIGPLKAIKKAMHEISELLWLLFLMAAVFIPVAFMSGSWGVYRQFSITMATAIILSGIVALTLTPALCAMMLKKQSCKPKKKTPITDL